MAELREEMRMHHVSEGSHWSHEVCNDHCEELYGSVGEPCEGNGKCPYLIAKGYK